MWYLRCLQDSAQLQVKKVWLCWRGYNSELIYLINTKAISMDLATCYMVTQLLLDLETQTPGARISPQRTIMKRELQPSPPVSGTGTRVFLEALCFPNDSKGGISSTCREHWEAHDNTWWWVLFPLEKRVRTVSNIKRYPRKTIKRRAKAKRILQMHSPDEYVRVYPLTVGFKRPVTLQHIQLAHFWTFSTCVGCRTHRYHCKIFLHVVGRLFVCAFQIPQTF